jgi:ABC-type multidrug transport system fused ATPase/permease subunit
MDRYASIEDYIIWSFLKSSSTGSLTARTTTDDKPTSSSISLQPGDIVISRTTLIATIIVFGLAILTSWAFLAILLLRGHRRRRETKAAQQWGRKPRYATRISMMQREIDVSYGRQYSSCHQNPPENPFMCSDSPVELMLPERVWEVPATPAKSAVDPKRKSMARSLFYDATTNLWLSRR